MTFSKSVAFDATHQEWRFERNIRIIECSEFLWVVCDSWDLSIFWRWSILYVEEGRDALNDVSRNLFVVAAANSESGASFREICLGFWHIGSWGVAFTTRIRELRIVLFLAVALNHVDFEKLVQRGFNRMMSCGMRRHNSSSGAIDTQRYVPLWARDNFLFRVHWMTTPYRCTERKNTDIFLSTTVPSSTGISSSCYKSRL